MCLNIWSISYHFDRYSIWIINIGCLIKYFVRWFGRMLMMTYKQKTRMENFFYKPDSDFAMKIDDVTLEEKFLKKFERIRAHWEECIE